MTGLVAVSRNWVIGKDGKIPWHSKEDFAWFKELTWGKNILVGRKTFSTLPPLKNRTVYVLTKSSLKHNDSDKSIFEIDEKHIPEDIIICGGRQIYYQFIPKCSELYLTEFDFKVEEEGEIVKFPYTNLDLGSFFKRRDQIKEIENGRIWHYTK